MVDGNRRDAARPSTDQLQALKNMTNEDEVKVVGEPSPVQVVQVDPFNRCLVVQTDDGIKTLSVNQLEIEGNVHFLRLTFVYRILYRSESNYTA